VLREEEPGTAGEPTAARALKAPAARCGRPDLSFFSDFRYCLVYAIVWPILRAALALLGGARVIGAECVPRQGPVLLAPNHASYSDPPIIGWATPRILWFMTKAHLFKTPLLAPLMRAFHAFPVDVDGVDREALRFSEELVRAGRVLCIFPEGGVSDDGRLQALKPGIGLIALRTGAPIVPVALVRTNLFVPPGRSLPCFARGGVEVRFGEPLNLSGLPTNTSRHAQADWIVQRLREAMVALLPPEQRPDGEGVRG
jgi:1-acyl-sn-glycerol-3-phosphate acyltransferase